MMPGRLPSFAGRTARLLVLLFCAARLRAQAPPKTEPAQTAQAAKLPTYDVAVIRPNTSGSGDVDIWTRDATFQAQNVPFKALLQSSFRVRRGLIFGLPAWAESARFDINAKIVDPDLPALRKLSADGRRTMLRVLLEDRFGLKWHLALKEVPTYELVVAKGGSRLKESPGTDQDGDTSMNNTDLTATGVPLSRLTEILSEQVDRPVVDKTGLAAKYDLHLKWTRDEARTAADNGLAADAPPSIFTALEEQLGLKLVPGKDAVETLVIDQVKPPTAN